MKLAVLALVVTTSIANAAPSKAVTTAETWLKTMLSGTPTLEKGKTLPYVIDSPEKACAKLAKGTAKTAADLKALKACFVATRDKLSKKPTYAAAELSNKDDGEVSKWLKTAPKGTTVVAIKYNDGPFSFEPYVAIGADNTVVAVFMYFNEPDDTGE